MIQNLFIPTPKVGWVVVDPVGEHYEYFRGEGFVVMRHHCYRAGAVHSFGYANVAVRQACLRRQAGCG